jgi:hypothetical protein
MTSNVPTQQQMAAFLVMRQARDKVANDLWAKHLAAQPARGTPPTRIAQNAQPPLSVASAGPCWTAYVPVSMASCAPSPPPAAGYASVVNFKPAAPAAGGGLSAVADGDDSTNVGLGLFRELSGTVAKLQEMYVENETQVAGFTDALNETRAEKELCQGQFKALDDYVTAMNVDLDAQKKLLQVEVDEFVRSTGTTDGGMIELFKKLLAAIPVLVKPSTSDV